MAEIAAGMSGAKRHYVFARRVADPFARGGWRSTLSAMSRPSRFVSYDSDIHVIRFSIDDEARGSFRVQAPADESEEEAYGVEDEMLAASLLRAFQNLSRGVDDAAASLAGLSAELKRDF